MTTGDRGARGARFKRSGETTNSRGGWKLGASKNDEDSDNGRTVSNSRGRVGGGKNGRRGGGSRKNVSDVRGHGRGSRRNGDVFDLGEVVTSSDTIRRPSSNSNPSSNINPNTELDRSLIPDTPTQRNSNPSNNHDGNHDPGISHREQPSTSADSNPNVRGVAGASAGSDVSILRTVTSFTMSELKSGGVRYVQSNVLHPGAAPPPQDSFLVYVTDGRSNSSSGQVSSDWTGG